MFQLIQGLTGFVGKIMKKKLIIAATAVHCMYMFYPSGLSLSFEASIANEDSPITFSQKFILAPLAFHIDHL